MRLHAAKAVRDDSTKQAVLRSSPAANAIALVCAAGILAVAIWYHEAELHSGSRVYLALAITIGFALAARLAHGVSTSGALAGAAVAFVFMLAQLDLRLFWVLLFVFFITLVATRAGSSRKQQLKVAEAERGRSASQVMANLGIAAGLLALPSFNAAHLLALAALAEAAADTASSEIGTAFSAPTVLIISWKRIPPGTDGGISLNGTVAGALAALMTAVCAAALGLVHVRGLLVVAAAGTVGMLVDSVLGATLERRGYLNNDVVNLLSTAVAAGICCWLLAFGF